MNTGTLARYRNLFTFVENWGEYFREKRQRPFAPLTITTKGRPLSFSVSSKGLYLVFKEIFLSDFYDIRHLAGALPKAPVVIDIGGNAGYFAMMLVSRIPDATIHAYEAMPENYALYTANVDRNPGLSTQVHVHHAAVTGSPTDSIEIFAEAEANSVTASVLREFDSHNTRSVRVPAISLADLMRAQGLEKVDLLKLDCEGSEYPIIYESPRELWWGVDAIFLEVHDLPGEGRNVTALIAYLEDVGYRCTKNVANNGCWAVFAQRRRH